MAMIARCDGCGKERPAEHNGRDWFKPSLWYERTTTDQKEILTACSRECIGRIHDQRLAAGKDSHRVVLPC